MQQTANYNLNLPEGTDVVNPLVDYNPNFSTIDSAMKANADRTVGRATCIKTGTTHVVTRSNTGSNLINFTATGDWNTGDTMTIDSAIVSVFLPDGTAALDGAFVINTEVFGILNGSRFTLYGAQELPGYTASDVSYSNAGSGLTATNIQAAVDEVVNNSKWALIADTGNLKAYKNANEVKIIMNAQVVPSAMIGNITTCTALGVPLPPATVVTNNYDGTNVVIDATGTISLLSTDLSTYVAGSVYCSISYPIV